jgi:hypothetical protein
LRRDAKVNDAVGKHGSQALTLSDSLAEDLARRECSIIQINEDS